MTRPILPPIPDVIPYEDEPGRAALRIWAEAFAVACELALIDKHLADVKELAAIIDKVKEAKP